MGKRVVGKIHTTAKIHRTAIIKGGTTLEVGENSRINEYCVLSCGRGIKIKSNVMIGPNTNIAGANHDYIQINKLMVNAGSIGLEVVIGHDVWIGAGCNITPGTTIGDGAVIAMGTTVMKDVHPGEIVGSGKQFTIGFREGFVDPCNSSFDKLRSKEASTVQGDKRP